MKIVFLAAALVALVAAQQGSGPLSQQLTAQRLNPNQKKGDGAAYGALPGNPIQPNPVAPFQPFPGAIVQQFPGVPFQQFPGAPFPGAPVQSPPGL
uniref:Secretory calcium-binding phosphoprotein 5 n=1 Tax=Steinernema glaseri TaxID=37863 RepID=A0A1I7YAL0_9BILA